MYVVTDGIAAGLCTEEEGRMFDVKIFLTYLEMEKEKLQNDVHNGNTVSTAVSSMLGIIECKILQGEFDDNKTP